MATSLGANRYNRQKWEDADYPILCQTCLGDNPYLRMTKEKFGKECKICDRPFTVFRWCPGQGMRFKKTEVCQTCSKLKNTCQTCLLDLEYGLPVQTRDQALQIKDNIAKSDVNKEYYTQNMEREIANSDGTVAVGAVGKSQKASDLLAKLARTAPYYKRNRPHICSFWVKGQCKRGEECPYRHEKPTDPDDPLADQNIKDRYYGINDPVANKLLARALEGAEMKDKGTIQMIPPQDKTITTLYVGGLGILIEEKDLRNHFYQYGEIHSVYMATKQNCAFVQFARREDAENAAAKSGGRLTLKNKQLNVRWGKSQSNRKNDSTKKLGSSQFRQMPGLPGALPHPSQVGNSTGYYQPGRNEPPPPGTNNTGGAATYTVEQMQMPANPAQPVYYPSQMPDRMGSRYYY